MKPLGAAAAAVLVEEFPGEIAGASLKHAHELRGASRAPPPIPRRNRRGLIEAW